MLKNRWIFQHLEKKIQGLDFFPTSGLEKEARNRKHRKETERMRSS